MTYLLPQDAMFNACARIGRQLCQKVDRELGARWRFKCNLALIKKDWYRKTT